MSVEAYLTTAADLATTLRTIAAPSQEETVTIADDAAWAEFWRDNAECLSDDYGDEATCRALAERSALMIGGGAAPLFRVGFARPAPSLDFLRRELERAERDLFRADYCESTSRAISEAADARRRIKAISEQIARIEEAL